MSVSGIMRTVIAAGLSAFLLVGFAQAARQVPEKDLHIFAFGDSITQGFARDGYGNWWGVDTPPRGQRITWWGYGKHLEQMIRDNLHVGGFVFNWGYGGLRSDQALTCGFVWDCIDTVLASGNADTIMIMLGANDLYAGISHTSTHYHLCAMVDKSLAAGVLPVLGTITPNTGIRGYDQIIRHHYNPLISELARDKGIYLADHHAALAGQWDRSYSSGDGLHLNDAGNQKLAATWFNAFPTISNNIYVLIEPAQARAAGARWRRVGTELWRASGTMEGGVAAGSHVVEFNALPGRRKPADQPVSVKPFMASVVRGEYATAGEDLSDEQWIIAFYAAYWNRAPDPTGLDYWGAQVVSGAISIPGVAENFALADEAKATYPYFAHPDTATDGDRADFVLAVYRHLLSRAAPEDDPGVIYWVNALRTGDTTPGAVIGHMVHAAIQNGGVDWLTIWNKIQAAEYFIQGFETCNRTWQESDLELAGRALDSIGDNPATLEAAKARIDGFFEDCDGVAPTRARACRAGRTRCDPAPGRIMP